MEAMLVCFGKTSHFLPKRSVLSLASTQTSTRFSSLFLSFSHFPQSGIGRLAAVLGESRAGTALPLSPDKQSGSGVPPLVSENQSRDGSATFTLSNKLCRARHWRRRNRKLHIP